MIVQCPSCRELVKMVDFTAHANVLRFTCAQCGTEQSVTSSAAAAAEAIPAPPPAPTPPPAAAPVEPPARANVSPRDAVLWKAWDKLQPQWQDPKAHDAFVASCQAAESLPFAGTRYRERLQANPEDALAKRGRDRVLGAAMALAQASRPDRDSADTGPSRIWFKVAAVVLAFILGGVVIRQMVAVTRHAASVEEGE